MSQATPVRFADVDVGHELRPLTLTLRGEGSYRSKVYYTPFKNDYAFGLAVQAKKGRKVISHGGGIEGFNTFLAYYPEDKLTVVVLANLNGSAPEAIAGQLAAIAHGEAVQLPSKGKEITVSPRIPAGEPAG